jgi:hypothetical protein
VPGSAQQQLPLSVIAVPAAADDDGRVAIDGRLSPRQSPADAASEQSAARQTGEHKMISHSGGAGIRPYAGIPRGCTRARGVHEDRREAPPRSVGAHFHGVSSARGVSLRIAFKKGKKGEIDLADLGICPQICPFAGLTKLVEAMGVANGDERGADRDRPITWKGPDYKAQDDLVIRWSIQKRAQLPEPWTGPAAPRRGPRACGHAARQFSRPESVAATVVRTRRFAEDVGG